MSFKSKWVQLLVFVVVSSVIFYECDWKPMRDEMSKIQIKILSQKNNKKIIYPVVLQKDQLVKFLMSGLKEQSVVIHSISALDTENDAQLRKESFRLIVSGDFFQIQEWIKHCESGIFYSYIENLSLEYLGDEQIHLEMIVSCFNIHPPSQMTVSHHDSFKWLGYFKEKNVYSALILMPNGSYVLVSEGSTIPGFGKVAMLNQQQMLLDNAGQEVLILYR